ncbi:lipoprotein [Pseudaminobacter sp. NGMCC 1.201702]|uniref:lipoprotein n=1 Tax=Pseudaminobacter sp. NGMCC 1.201702 TaxID=3391825 RepID=UPI0039F03615
MTASRFVMTLLLLAAATAVSACGRKSGLDTPYQAAVDARKEAEKANEPLPPEPEKPVADKPFILDGLI